MRECTIATMGDSGIMGGGSWEKSVAEPALMDEVAAVFSFVAALCVIVLLLLLLLLSFCAMVCLDARIRTHGRQLFEQSLFRTHGICLQRSLSPCFPLFNDIFDALLTLLCVCCCTAVRHLDDGKGWKRKCFLEREKSLGGTSVSWRNECFLEEEVSLDEEVILARRPCGEGWWGCGWRLYI